jgi:cytoskeleton protein RodZ
MAANRHPADFGRKLREARERQGVSLRQIANATKISVAALEALERNDISRLPGGIFSRAFVRSYAIEVGLDPDRAIQEFIAQFSSDGVAAGHPVSDPIEDRVAIESDRKTASTFLRLVMISVPVAIAVAYFATAGRRYVRGPDPPPAAVDPVLPSAPPGRSAPAPQLPEAVTASEPGAAAPTVPAVADRLTVGLSVTRPCWVSATVDGQKTIDRLLRPGESQTVDVTREMVLTAADGAALAITLNGAEAKPLGPSGQAVTRRLDLANFKDFLQTR